MRYRQIPVDWGICIDLFPMYPVSDWASRKAEVFFFKAARKLLLCEMTQYDGPGRPPLVKALEKIPLALRRRVMDAAIGWMARHGEDTQWVYLTCKGGRLARREMIFGAPRQLPFEGREYPVPSDYEGFLTMQYGDYRTPPPPQERGGTTCAWARLNGKCEGPRQIPTGFLRPADWLGFCVFPQSPAGRILWFLDILPLRILESAMGFLPNFFLYCKIF